MICTYSADDLRPLMLNKYFLHKPFNSYEWSRLNFSLQYQYNMKQTSDENKEKYQLGDYKLIQYQILQTNITRTIWLTVRRITNEILGVKGLRKVFLGSSNIKWVSSIIFILESWTYYWKASHTYHVNNIWIIFLSSPHLDCDHLGMEIWMPFW